jgi:hypothetical protein
MRKDRYSQTDRKIEGKATQKKKDIQAARKNRQKKRKGETELKQRQIK